jgi:hypothetical protein
MRSFWAILIITIAGALGPAKSQNLTDTYRQAAQQYRALAARCAGPGGQCYLANAQYYDCIANQLGGSSSACTQPSCSAACSSSSSSGGAGGLSSGGTSSNLSPKMQQIQSALTSGIGLLQQWSEARAQRKALEEQLRQEKAIQDQENADRQAMRELEQRLEDARRVERQRQDDADNLMRSANSLLADGARDLNTSIPSLIDFNTGEVRHNPQGGIPSTIGFGDTAQSAMAGLLDNLNPTPPANQDAMNSLLNNVGPAPINQAALNDLLGSMGSTTAAPSGGSAPSSTPDSDNPALDKAIKGIGFTAGKQIIAMSEDGKALLDVTDKYGEFVNTVKDFPDQLALAKRVASGQGTDEDRAEVLAKGREEWEHIGIINPSIRQVAHDNADSALLQGNNAVTSFEDSMHAFTADNPQDQFAAVAKTEHDLNAGHIMYGFMTKIPVVGKMIQKTVNTWDQITAAIHGPNQ